MKRIVVFLTILVVLATGLASCGRSTTPVNPSVEPPAQTENSTQSETPTPTKPNLPQEEKVFFGDLGVVFWPLDSEGKRFVAYILGSFETPGPGPYPLRSFPLAIEKDLEGKNMGVIGRIPDPNINEIGRTWETVINDTEQNVVCRVKLTRVNETYKYKIEFYVSPDGGKHWFPPTTYPAN